MLYSEKMKEILLKLGVDTTKLDDNLYSTLLEEISESTSNIGSGTIEITENGEFEVGVYSKANVNVSYMDMMQQKVNNTKSCMYLFYNDKTDLSYAKSLDTSQVTDMDSMFYNCENMKISQISNTDCVTDMRQMYYRCFNLEVVPEVDVKYVTDMGNIFYQCESLKEIHFKNIKASLDISASTLFTREALLEILNNLQTVTDKVLKMGETNLAKLTDEDKSIATNKGWQLR